MVHRIVLLTLVSIALSGQNRALYLDGTGDYVDLPHAIIDYDSFSVEAWVFMFGNAGGLEQQSTIFCQGTDVTGCYNSKVLFHAMARANLPNSTFGVRTDQSCFERATAAYPGQGAWHHMVGTRDPESIRLYVDGELIATESVGMQGSFSNNISYINIGRHQHDGQAFGYFFGLLDEIRIWDYALAPAEIIARMHTELAGDETGLAAYWNFNDSTAVDVSGNGNDGVFMDNAATVRAELPLPSQGSWGDLNDDGQLDISDVILLINHILGM